MKTQYCIMLFFMKVVYVVFIYGKNSLEFKPLAECSLFISDAVLPYFHTNTFITYQHTNTSFIRESIVNLYTQWMKCLCMENKVLLKYIWVLNVAPMSANVLIRDARTHTDVRCCHIAVSTLTISHILYIIIHYMRVLKG